MKYPKRKFKRKAKVPKPVKTYVKKEFDKLVEDKQAGGLIAGFDSSYTGTYTLLNGVAQGTNQGQRIGMQLKNKYLILRLIMNQNAGFVGLSERIRVMLIWDKQPNGAAPTANQLLTITAAGQAFISPININASKRYRIVYDKLYSLQSRGGANNVAESKMITIKKNLKLNTKYMDTGATIASIQTNSLYLVTISQEDLAIRIAGTFDHRYEDA